MPRWPKKSQAGEAPEAGQAGQASAVVERPGDSLGEAPKSGFTKADEQTNQHLALGLRNAFMDAAESCMAAAKGQDELSRRETGTLIEGQAMHAKGVLLLQAGKFRERANEIEAKRR